LISPHKIDAADHTPEARLLFSKTGAFFAKYKVAGKILQLDKQTEAGRWLA
jgi:hypothetical protein